MNASPNRNHLGLTTSDFHKAVTKVRRRSSYGLDRQQAESLVACLQRTLQLTMATRSVNLQYCQINDEHCPLQ